MMSDFVPHLTNSSSLYESVFGQNTRWNHREGRWECPHCDYDPTVKGRFKWLLKPSILEVHLRARAGKNSSVIVISSCPKCKELTWEHFSIKMLLSDIEYHKITTIDPDQLRGEVKHRVRAEYQTWLNGSCRRCRELESSQTNPYRPYGLSTECDRVNGFGDHREYPSGDVCERFIPLPEGTFNTLTIDPDRSYYDFILDHWELLGELVPDGEKQGLAERKEKRGY